jgi:glycosyltransferase involved in cell wall biosynthesis
MRLLLDLQGAQGGSRHSGLGRYSLEFARALAAGRGGHDVLLLLNAARTASAAALEAEFAPVLGAANIHRFTPPEGCAAGSDPHHPLRRLAEQIRAQAILALAPDMVHLGSVFEGWNDTLVTNWPAALPRPRHVATLHDLIPLTRRGEYLEGPWRDAGLVPWYMRQLLELRGMDGLLCNSEATRREGLVHLDMAPEQLVTVGGGVGAQFFAASPGPAPVAGRYILCLGLNDIRKNEARLIAAMGLLPPGLREGLRLVVTGSIPAGHLERLAREAGLAEGTILHLGMVEDAVLPALYAHAALFVLPSLAEGFGLPLAEAMAAGAPFAASRAGALPEVAGRDDVLFDPLDTADMAAVIGRVLGDAALAEDLRRWGPDQAARHSWSACAVAGWAALERWAGPARAALPPLVVTGPLPPQPSGIADYSAELLPALAAHYNITLVSESRPMEGIAAGFPWMAPTALAAAPHGTPRLLHQLGNSALHHFQHQGLLPLRPAVSVLHDIAMPEYRRWAAKAAPEPQAALLGAIYANHGYPALLAALGDDADAVAASLSMSAEVVEGSMATIVHSEAARGMLRETHGAGLLRDVHVVPHLRRPAALPERAAARARLGLAADQLVVASFGACVPKKLPLRLIEAFAQADLPQEAILVFVGEAQPGLEDVMQATARAQGLSMGLGGQTSRPVRLTGGISRAGYEDWLAAADVAVQLRGRHQGETSGAVIDALSAGLPCIVNAKGSMAELPPGSTLRLEENFTDAALILALAALAADPARRRALGTVGQGFVAAELGPAVIARRYRAVIEAAHAAAPALAVLAEAAVLPALPQDEALALGSALAQSFPAPRQARAWITRGVGWNRSDFEDYRGALRPEPARLEADHWLSDHAGLAQALALGRPAAPDAALRLQPGDVVVCDADPGMLPAGVTWMTPGDMAGR